MYNCSYYMGIFLKFCLQEKNRSFRIKARITGFIVIIAITYIFTIISIPKCDSINTQDTLMKIFQENTVEGVDIKLRDIAFILKKDPVRYCKAKVSVNGYVTDLNYSITRKDWTSGDFEVRIGD